MIARPGQERMQILKWFYFRIQRYINQQHHRQQQSPILAIEPQLRDLHQHFKNQAYIRDYWEALLTHQHHSKTWQIWKSPNTGKFSCFKFNPGRIQCPKVTDNNSHWLDDQSTTRIHIIRKMLLFSRWAGLFGDDNFLTGVFICSAPSFADRDKVIPPYLCLHDLVL